MFNPSHDQGRLVSAELQTPPTGVFTAPTQTEERHNNALTSHEIKLLLSLPRTLQGSRIRLVTLLILLDVNKSPKWTKTKTGLLCLSVLVTPTVSQSQSPYVPKALFSLLNLNRNAESKWIFIKPSFDFKLILQLKSHERLK